MKPMKDSLGVSPSKGNQGITSDLSPKFSAAKRKPRKTQ